MCIASQVVYCSAYCLSDGVCLWCNLKAQKFVDFRQINVRGGCGGNGCMSFLRLFANEWAGPDGGDGGNGGHVIFQGKFLC